MNIMDNLSNIPPEFYNSEICQYEFRNSNKIIYRIWFFIMTLMNISVILLSLYYIMFVEGESEIIGNYLYIGAYSFQIIFSAIYLKIFCNDTLTLKKYNLRVDIFIYECMLWILFVSCLDLYYTGSYSAFVGGLIDMSILYLKPKKFDYTAIGIAILYCIIMVYLMLDSSRDELGSIIFDNTVLIEIINTSFNVLILTIALVFFIHIKYNSKVSDIYKTHKLQELSNLDVLTGLFNRMSLTQYIESINSSKHNSLVISMMDIDNFKKINDTYGHPVGDKCIHLVGEKINEISSKGYRYGGEEFLIIFENSEVSEVCAIMENFRKNIENSKIDAVKFTISIGVSDKYNSTDIQKIIEQADERLYKAKKTGKNKIVFE